MHVRHRLLGRLTRRAFAALAMALSLTAIAQDRPAHRVVAPDATITPQLMDRVSVLQPD